MFNQPLVTRGFTGCLSKAGLAEATSANEFKTAAPNGAGIDYVIDGIAYHKADGDDIAFTVHDTQADLTECLYLIQINAAGTFSSKKGTEVLTADLEADRAVLHWPEPDAANCPVGAIRVKNVAGTFTTGTTDLGAATVTDTYYDFAGGMPDGPLTA